MAKITKIKMTVGKHEIEMSLEEAKDFQKLLNETFPDQQSPIVINPIIMDRGCRYPYEPRPYFGYDVTCSGDTLSWSASSR